MNLLITGGAGFIGSNYIISHIKNKPEDRIINLDKLTYAGNLENLRSIEGNKNYQFVQGDICDERLVDFIIKNNEIDTIINFAAESHVDRSIANSAPFIQTNIEGTRVLLDAALHNGKIRFHHISTDEVFGHLSPSDEPFSEKTPYDPRSPYAASKASSDHLVRAYFTTHGLPITISNCSNNYGPYQYPEKFIPLAITNILEGKKIPLYGKGAAIRDWIQVEDHNRGVELILEKGKPGETYLFGGGGEMAGIDLARMIINLMDASEDMIEFVSDRPGHDMRYAINSDKSQKELGWKKEVEFEKGLADLIDWYKKNESWWKKLK
ncbi:dTDP-glucose 4,6-dehydratase [Candidatus Falkowbacteria bacterium]|nr:dTDP-glucose 4,6-dehydratase [Candidatus Falkowbacteria bacterium]